MATPKWAEIMAMPETELEAYFDSRAVNAEGGTQFWADLLVYRSQMEIAKETARVDVSIRRMTKWLVALTVVAIIATAIGPAAAVIAATH